MILLFSAGFDHKICIWNPYISSLIHKIEGHLSPILALRVVEGTHQLISMDSEGIVKITDTRRFNIISSFSVQTDQAQGQAAVSCFITISKPAKQILRLVFAGKALSFYEYDKNYNPFTADENTVVSCRYVKQTLCFFTPAGNKVKVWSALNGDVEKIYMEVSPHEISAFDFDFLKKRMIIGDTKGNIALYNTANGAKMKNLTKHAGEITHLVATQNTESKTDIFISCALDNEVRISRQTEESFEVIRTIYLKKDLEISCLRFCPENRLIIVATNVGSLAFFDIETGKNVGTYLQDITEQFTSISRACKEVVIATSSNGNVTLVGIPPFPYRFEKLTAFKHKDFEKQGATVGVRLSSYSRRSQLLYVVDDKMYLSCYDLSQIFNQLEKSELGKEKIEFQRRNLIKDIIAHSSILLRWQVKAHAETVKVLEYIEEEDILVTASFDKKVKIWDAQSGDYIDSLQQNYNKSIPEPLAFYDLKKSYLYTKDRKRAFDNAGLTPLQLDFDPFLIEAVRDTREDYFPQESSNKEWNLNINFQDVVRTEQLEFLKITQQLSEFGEPEPPCSPEDTLLAKKLEILQRKRKLLKQIRNENGTEQTHGKDEKQQRKYSTNYFRRSMIKCIQNFVDKNESIELMQQLKNDKDRVFGRRKHFDYVPIYKMVHQTEKTVQELQEHRQYVLDLAKRQTENIANSRKNAQVVLSREQSDAANRLYQMLKTTEGRTNHVPINYSSKDPTCPRQSSARPQPKSNFFALHQKRGLPTLSPA